MDEDETDVDAEDESDSDSDAGHETDADGENGPTTNDPDGGSTEDGRDGGGAIVVSTWICPADAAGGEPVLDDLYAGCSAAEAGVILASADGWEVTTGGAGPVAFDGLPPGDYRLGVDVPVDFGDSIVSCQRSGVNGILASELAPERVAIDGRDESGIAIVLLSGATWTCDWFNVAADS